MKATVKQSTFGPGGNPKIEIKLSEMTLGKVDTLLSALAGYSTELSREMHEALRRALISARLYEA